MNYTDKIFEMLGVKPYEDFYLKNNNGIYLGYGNDEKIKYHITKDFLVRLKTHQGVIKSSVYDFEDILKGIIEIVKIPEKKEPTYKEFGAFVYAWSCGCEWLAKNKDGSVFAYSKKPIKFYKSWVALSAPGEIKEPKSIRIETHLEFLSWEDKEPYFMPELPEFKHLNDFCPVCGRRK